MTLAVIDQLIQRFRAITGWRRIAVAFCGGLLAALAQAPFHALPLLALSMSALVLLLDGAALGARPAKAGFATGWAFGFGYFLIGLYWLAYSFLVQAEEFAWMAPFAVLGMPAFLGLFTGAAGALIARLGGKGAGRILIAAAIFTIAEYLRGHILTGLPWNLTGQALAGSAAGAQTAAWWGAYGLSLVVTLIAMTPVAFIDTGARGLLKGAGACLLLTAALYGVGAARLARVNPGDHQDVFLRIVQPNIPQREKIDDNLWSRNYERHIALSAAPAPGAGTLFVLWPENAVPVIDESAEGLAAVSARLPKNAILLAGAVRRETGADNLTRYYNSISAIPETPEGRKAVAHYDKHHLVPFGEYLPMQGVLRRIGLAQLAPYDDGFTPGEGPRIIALDGAPAFAPLVCYEAIFPGRIFPKGARPEWIATVTNDGWFGDSSGPRQHLEQARLRVVETGLPMARSANTGVSALFDAAGRLKERIPLYHEGVIDAPLPKRAPSTLYNRVGDLIFFLLVGGFVAGGFSSVRQRDRGPKIFTDRAEMR